MLYEITIQNKEITSFGNLVVWFVCCNMGTKVSLNYTNVELQDVLLSIKSKPVMYWCLVIRYWMYTEEYR